MSASPSVSLGRDDPLAIIFVSSFGDKLMFKYPCLDNAFTGNEVPSSNIYAVKKTDRSHHLTRLPDEIMAYLLVVRPTLTDKRFDIKIGDIRLVGYPLTMTKHAHEKTKKSPCIESFTVHIVIALPDTVSEDTVKCYQNLSCHLSAGLRHEQSRCCYLCDACQTMRDFYDDFVYGYSNGSTDTKGKEDQRVKPSVAMLQKGMTVPVIMKDVFDMMASHGVVRLSLNKWSEISFSFPNKTHNKCLPAVTDAHRVKEEEVFRFIYSMKPFHSLLLLEDSPELIHSLPVDSSPALQRLLKVVSPFKNFMDMAADSDLELMQVFRLSAHLVYWAKAQVIYPLCESSVYMLAKNSLSNRLLKLSNKFAREFPGEDLRCRLASFHRRCRIKECGFKSQDVQSIVWMLKYRVIVQVHDYIILKPNMVHMEKITGKDGPLIAPSSTGVATPAADFTLGTEYARSNDELLSYDAMLEKYFTKKGRETLSRLSPHPEERDLLIRLCPYLTGAYHLDMIMYYENLHKSKIYLWVHRFRELVYRASYPDVSISSYDTPYPAAPIGSLGVKTGKSPQPGQV